MNIFIKNNEKIAITTNAQEIAQCIKTEQKFKITDVPLIFQSDKNGFIYVYDIDDVKKKDLFENGDFSKIKNYFNNFKIEFKNLIKAEKILNMELYLSDYFNNTDISINKII